MNGQALKERAMRKIAEVMRPHGGHWVGNGFPVRTLFSYGVDSATVSPFLLFDYAGPHVFEPSTAPRGVGQHPHRGFETVTIAYDGEVAHRDSTGKGGVIGPGDVQWMTAASGILHEEYHSPGFTKTGGPFRMVQLWVNLPAKDKMATPGYQPIAAANIPAVDLPDGAGPVRVIAGRLRGARARRTPSRRSTSGMSASTATPTDHRPAGRPQCDARRPGRACDRQRGAGRGRGGDGRSRRVAAACASTPTGIRCCWC